MTSRHWSVGCVFPIGCWLSKMNKAVLKITSSGSLSFLYADAGHCVVALCILHELQACTEVFMLNAPSIAVFSEMPEAYKQNKKINAWINNHRSHSGTDLSLQSFWKMWLHFNPRWNETELTSIVSSMSDFSHQSCFMIRGEPDWSMQLSCKCSASATQHAVYFQITTH